MSAPIEEGKNKRKPISRQSSYGPKSSGCDLPKADEILTEAFSQLGYFLNNGDGPTPLTWQEINSFSDCRPLPLSFWEREQLKLMSRELCVWIKLGRDPQCEAPWHSKRYNVISATDDSVTKAFNSWFDMAS